DQDDRRSRPGPHSTIGQGPDNMTTEAKTEVNGNWLDNAQTRNWRAVTWDAIEALAENAPSADELDRFLDQFEAVLELHDDFGRRDGDILLNLTYRTLYAALHGSVEGPEGKLKYEDARALVLENVISHAIKRHKAGYRHTKLNKSSKQRGGFDAG